MKIPQISVIIPIYNVEKYIEKCCRSLFDQSLNNLEYIFVDDCSPDNSIEVLEKILKEYPHRKLQVKIIRHRENQGQWKARTTGFENAAGDYIIHCDSDDWIELDMYEKMYNKAIKENADIVCCNLLYEYKNTNKECKYPYDIETADAIKEMKLSLLYSSLSNKLIKKSLYISHDIWPFENINMTEDLGMTIRLRYFSEKTIIIQEAFYHYRMHSDSTTNNLSLNRIQQQMKCAEEIDNFFLKQGSQTYNEFLLPILYIKFNSKNYFLSCSSVRNLEMWKNTFPESSKDIWKYKDINIKLKFFYWLASCGFEKISIHLFFVNKKINKLKSKFKL